MKKLDEIINYGHNCKYIYLSNLNVALPWDLSWAGVYKHHDEASGHSVNGSHHPNNPYHPPNDVKSTLFLAVLPHACTVIYSPVKHDPRVWLGGSYGEQTENVAITQALLSRCFLRQSASLLAPLMTSLVLLIFYWCAIQVQKPRGMVSWLYRWCKRVLTT